jgi:hypothetical protein
MKLILNTKSMDDYRKFLAIKQFPKYHIRGHLASFPSEYATRLGIEPPKPRQHVVFEPNPACYDYQRDLGTMAAEKRKFAMFADPGRGKTLMFLDLARHGLRVLPKGKCVLLVAPLMTIDQTIQECERFFGGDLKIEKIPASHLQTWLNGDRKERLGIVNYEAFKNEIKGGDLGMLIGDETSMMKSMYGKYGTRMIRLAKGLDWKEANTGTPAPNDRIEYGNHAIYLDQFPTLNSFLAKYFVNRGQTGERWEMKQHAIEPFYRALSHWAFFLNDPSVYGWKDHIEPLPPIHIHYHPVDLTQEQERLVMENSRQLIPTKTGGIAKRTSWGQIAKGWWHGKPVATNKPAEILRLTDSFKDESTIIWCIYDAEQKILARLFPDAANIMGSTKMEKRLELIEDFKAGRRKQLITKGKILGFGQNLQIATRHVFSGLQDSYEMFYQCVKRSNRIGSTLPLNVHIPLTSIEEPMVENVMRKAKDIQEDTEAQERIFRKARG